MDQSTSPVGAAASVSHMMAKTPYVAALVWTGALIVVLVGARALGWLQPLELIAYDTMLLLRSAPQSPPGAAVIAIDDRALEAWGWPVPDGNLAEVITAAENAGATVIGLDIYRDRPVEPGHADLVAAMASKKVHGAMKFARDGEAAVSPPPALEPSGRFGFVDFPVDRDGTLRRALIYADDGTKVFPSLALQSTLGAMADAGVTPRADADDPVVMRLGAGALAPLEPGSGPYEAADAGGYQILLDFRRPVAATPVVDALDLVTDGSAASELAGRVVFIGIASELVKDLVVTPRAGATPSGLLHGVMLHAWVSDQLQRIAAGDARSLHTVPPWAEIAIIAAIGLVGAVTGWRVVSARGLAIAGAVTLSVGLLVAYGLFEIDIWVPVVPALAAGLGGLGIAVGGRMAGERRERQALMRLFSQQVSPEIARDLWDHRSEFADGGGLPRPLRLQATVMFIDLAGSTQIADRMEPEAFIGWVGRYLECMGQAAIDAGGLVDKYTGDGLMAVFGVPVPRWDEAEVAEDARAAVQCATGMAEALDRFNRSEREHGNPPASMRIGLHSGPVHAGLVGASERAQYTVMGSVVNGAARLEGLKDPSLSGPDEPEACRILLSASTAALIGDTMPLQKAGQTTLRGFAEPIDVYRLAGAAPQPIDPSLSHVTGGAL